MSINRCHLRVFHLLALSTACALSFFLSTSCGKQTPFGSKEEGCIDDVRSIFNAMTPGEKAAQVLMTGIDGKESFAKYLYGHFEGTVPGAILLFKSNVADSPEGVFTFLQDCDRAFDSLSSPAPVLFAIDHEGGLVYRMGTVTSRLPSAADVATHLDVATARALYESAGTQLSTLGIHMNLAPVAETLMDENKEFLGTRSFSSSGKLASAYAAAAVYGYQKAGVAAVVKHFPGNGSGDPHRKLPVIDVSRKALEKNFIAPFKATMKSRPDAVLVSHVIVSAIDPDAPFCLSHRGVTGLLRRELGFDGLVITDDIAMSALSKNGYEPEQAAVLALHAGCDMIMTSSPDIRSVARAIADEAIRDKQFSKRLDEAVLRVLNVKARVGLISTSRKRFARFVHQAGGSPGSSDRFDVTGFLAARKEGDRILEEMYGKH